MAELITDGQFKGYYSIPNTLMRERLRNDVEVGERDLYNAYRSWQLSLEAAAGGGNNVWYRYSPGPGKQILGFNRSYLPQIDGFYYVRRDPSINLRQQLYALEQKLVPASGNTELFNLQLAKVQVPEDWCPYFLDPCPSDTQANQTPNGWCQRCKTTPVKSATSAQQQGSALSRWLFLLFLAAVVGWIITRASSPPKLNK